MPILEVEVLVVGLVGYCEAAATLIGLGNWVSVLGCNVSGEEVSALVTEI